MTPPNSFYQSGTLFSFDEKLVLGFCGDSRYAGYGMTTFSHALMRTFASADPFNFAILRSAYPEIGQAWVDFRSGNLGLREKTANMLACQSDRVHTREEIIALTDPTIEPNTHMELLSERPMTRRLHVITEPYQGDPGDEHHPPRAA